MKTHAHVILAGAILAAISSVTCYAQVSSPLAIPGSVLWLDGDDLNGDGIKDTGASGALITSWVDKAVADGIHTVTVTAGAPTLDFGVAGTHNAVHFTGGSQDKLDNTAFNVMGDYTVFTVVQTDGATFGTHVLSGINNAGTDTVLYRAGDGAFDLYSGQSSGNVNVALATVAGATGYKLFGYQANSTGPDVGILQSVQSVFELGGGATGAQLNGIRIGNLDRSDPSNVTQSEAWNGHIAEVIIYNRKVTAAEATSVNKYLNSKYNLGVAFATGRGALIEKGNVTAGDQTTPSTLTPTSQAVVSQRVNVALSSKGGVGFAKDLIAAPYSPSHLNDGLYATGFDNPWIGANNQSFAGIKLAGATTIDEIGFQDEFPNRRNAAFIFEYTLDNLSGTPADPTFGLDPTVIDSKNWQILDVFQIQDTADTRYLFGFTPIAGVTGVRVRVESSQIQTAISELEVWQAVPEPATGGLAIAGGLGLLIRRWRRR
ncbi:MAG: hypothetical protein JWL59_75 [Chthoniobacteraceae bacterium]|nr:hypothetical protein [Chthoniobacteraceae bacterium]